MFNPFGIVVGLLKSQLGIIIEPNTIFENRVENVDQHVDILIF